MKYIYALITLVVLVVLVVFFFFKSYFLPEGTPLIPGSMINLGQTPTAQSGKAIKEVPYIVEEYTSNLKIPWSIVFTSNERLLVTEREGSIREVINGVLREKPLITFGETSHTGEEGLLGMVLDPNYQSNKFIYAVIAYGHNAGTSEKVIRLKDLGNSIVLETNILDNIPASQYHDGGTLEFGPDGKLYISTGDALNKNNAQLISSLSGKILRVNSDGTIPSDNPFKDSPVWSLGHRNPQGFDWYPESSIMFETEHGPSIIDGPEGGDEVNVIDVGENYGWPKAHHEIHVDGLIDPKLLFTPAFAPASGMFYKGKVFPQFYGNFFFGGLKGEGIMRVIVDPKNPTKILSYGKLANIDFGRIREMEEGPDGYIYFTTSNRDGRGTPRTNDDKIYRIVPEKKK